MAAGDAGDRDGAGDAASSGHLETVHLDEVDGFGFEEVCRRILDRAKWGGVKRIGGVADGGRDLVVDGPGGKVIVECKHQPGSSVGRPVIQKLHSALVSYGAVKGVVMTTGRFTREAAEHTKSLDPPVELMDFGRVSAMAERVGIRLVMGSQTSTVFCMPVPGGDEVRARVVEEMQNFQSHPAQLHKLITPGRPSMSFDPHYVISVNVDQEFKTSVGVVHSIRERGQRLIIDACTGRLLDPKQTAFLEGAPLVDAAAPGMLDVGYPANRGRFGMDVTSIRKLATAMIVDMHTTTVSYTGRNNVRYAKRCVPGPRSISFCDIKQVLLPRYAEDVSVLESRYRLAAIRNGAGIMITDAGIWTCRTCGKAIGGGHNGLACNSCGALAHAPRAHKGHSYRCAECDKTLCRGCTFWTRRLLFFKRMLCKRCADLGKAPIKRLGNLG